MLSQAMAVVMQCGGHSGKCVHLGRDFNTARAHSALLFGRYLRPVEKAVRDNEEGLRVDRADVPLHDHQVKERNADLNQRAAPRESYKCNQNTSRTRQGKHYRVNEDHQKRVEEPSVEVSVTIAVHVVVVLHRQAKVRRPKRCHGKSAQKRTWITTHESTRARLRLPLLVAVARGHAARGHAREP